MAFAEPFGALSLQPRRPRPDLHGTPLTASQATATNSGRRTSLTTRTVTPRAGWGYPGCLQGGSLSLRPVRGDDGVGDVLDVGGGCYCCACEQYCSHLLLWQPHQSGLSLVSL